MRKRLLRVLAGAVSLMLFTASFTACSGGSTNGKEKDTQNAATVEEKKPLAPVDLVWYVVADPHKDQKMVDDEVNKRLKNDLNCTVKLNFTSWTEWQTKYNLLLASGEKIDMIFSATWANFTKYARGGAFMDLKEMLPKYAPKTWAAVPKEDWQWVTYNGKIFAVPCTTYEFTPSGLYYREDLRKKYNLPEIKDVASIEAYLDGIKKNEKGMTPIGGNPNNEIYSIFLNSAKFESIQGSETSLLQATSYNTPRDIVAFPMTSQFEDYVKKMKEWADKGYWSKDAISSKASPQNEMNAGKAAMAWMNPATARGKFQGYEKDHPDWEMGYFPLSRMKGYVMPNSPINNGMSIPKSAANPERSLMVLDLFRNDLNYWRLTTWGIEGYHWQVSDDGKKKISPANGQDPKVNPGFWTTSWGWNVDKNNLPPEKDWKGWDTLNNEFQGMKKPNIFAGIYIDYDPIKTEQAAINDVKSKYEGALIMGLVPDPDKTLKEYREKLKAAGLDKYVTEIKKQVDQYFTEVGVK